MSNCAIFTSSSNPIAEEVKNKIGNDCPVFDLSLVNSEELIIDAERLFLNGIDLTSFKYIWLHNFQYQNPIIPSAVEQCDWSLWRAEYLVEQQRYSALASLFAELNRRGVILLNAPTIQLSTWMVQQPLELLRDLSYAVPDMLCTNDMQTAEEFVKQYKQVIWRPATGCAAWQLFKTKQQDDLIDPTKPPVLLAEVVSGLMLRAYVLFGKVVLVLANTTAGYASIDENSHTEHLEQFWHIQASAELEAELIKIAEDINLIWGEIIFVQDDVDKQQPVIYGVNSDPEVSSLPLAYKDYLTSALAYGLMGNLSDIFKLQNKLPEDKQNRQTLFTKRMMQVLFDFEKIKYS